jgi:filamentous hemagglutinin family protein
LDDFMPKRNSLVFLARTPEYCFSAAKILLAYLSTLAAILLPAIAKSQPITSDGSAGTIVAPNPTSSGNPTVYDITGGQLSQDGKNLFHSFGQFGLNAGQTANFLSNPSIVNILGRVTGGNPSVINGVIQVTGGNSNLFLMNPAGIVFGAGAQLNLPGDFTATTATRIGFGNNNSFNTVGTNNYSTLVGTPNTFIFETSGTPGAIVNAAQLAVKEGNNLSLLGGTVVSTGKLTAPEGNITVAAVPGQNLIRISQEGRLLNLEIQPCGNTGNCAFSSTSGLPNPLSLPQLLTGQASSQTGLTVTSTGQVVLANSGLVVPQFPGTVVLSGSADTSTNRVSQAGGSVQLRGNLVSLVDKAEVNVSGTAGGGRVLIGGDVRGQNVAANQLRTFVGPEVTIEANAGSTGNGGQVRVWADDTTRFLGSLNARGGTNGGSGGFVEVSGKNNLTFSGSSDTSALRGGRGTLFLNSSNFTIADAPAVNPSQNRALANNPQILVSDNSIGSNTITWGQIANLVPNNNLILQATGQLAIADIFGNTPGITQNNVVNLGQNAGTLTLRSTGSSITFNDFNDTLRTSGSAINLEAATSITAGNFLTNGGTVSLNAQRGNVTTGQINTSSVSGDGGRVSLNAQSGSITTGQINSSSQTRDGGRVSLNAQRGITVNSIDTRNIRNGTGGNVDITTTGLFRAFGTNSANASISTDGGIKGGSINIQHGGRSFGTPFTVGSDYNGRNGTAGAITTDANNSIPSGTFTGSVTFGSAPTDIQIIAPGCQTCIQSQAQAANQVQNPSQSTDSSSPQQRTSTNTPVLVSSNRSPMEIGTGFVETEKSLSRQFQQYFGREFIATQNFNLNQAQETLEQIDRVTGKRPALIYAVFVPASVDSSATTQAQKPQPTDQLELLLVTAEGKPIRKRVEGATRDRVQEIALQFRRSVTNLKSDDDYLSPAQQLYKWLVEPLEADLQANKISNLVFIMDSGLRAIPLAALHDGRGFLVERYSLGLMPSLNLTDTRFSSLKNTQVLAMGAETFPDQKPLPAVPVELSVITQQLWKGKAFLNSAFTLENLKAQRQQSSFGIIHLATHADFQPGAPDKSYIQLANDKLLLNEMPQLNWSNPPTELLVLSACRTAVGSEQAELGFAGLAVQAGVKSAVASLWVISDEATLGLMTEFYRQLRDTPIKAEALRQAQLALLKGQIYIESGKLHTPQGEVPLPPMLAELPDKKLAHPYYWAAFTIIGNPW